MGFISVIAGGGTGVGETKTVDLADGSTLGINTWSHNLTYTGSGGVGFSDLGGPVALGYYYNSADRANCGGILAACGWGTSFDEGFTPGSNGVDFVYRDAAGNRYGVDQNQDAQLISGAPTRLERYRYTLVDENSLASWSSTVPTVVTSGAYSGTAALAVPATTGATVSSLFTPVDVTHYLLVSFAAKSTATGTGIAFWVNNTTTGYGNYLIYTLGTDFVTNGLYRKIALGGSVASWNAVFQRSLLADLVSQGFGGAYDSYQVTGLGFWGNGQNATDFYDAVRFEGRGSGIFSDTGSGQPAWTSGAAYATANTTDKVQGANSIQVAPTTAAGSPTCAACLGGDLVAYPYLRWAWKKVGGSSIANVVNIRDTRSNQVASITYYAGPSVPAGVPVCPGTSTPCAVQVALTAPTDWLYVTRNVLEDARQLGAFYNNADTGGNESAPSGGPVPDAVLLTGYTLAALDGQYALFDDESVMSLPYLGDQWGQITGDDFVVTFRGGAQHRFDQAGHLTALEDPDNNRTALAWTYDAAHLVETLGTIRSASDNQPLLSGTSQREISVSTTSGSVKFTESLGSTTSPTGRTTEFDRTIGGNLAQVSPARRSAACAGSGPTGCLVFGYATGSFLVSVADPRDAAASPTTAIAWTGADPTRISSNATGGTLLAVTYAAAGFPLRTRIVDADGAATGSYGYARYEDLSPNGSVLTAWAPVACAAAGCAATSPAAPVDRLVTYAADGIDQYSSETHYRLTTVQMGADPTAGTMTTRRGTLAGAKVDNFSDPLTAGLTAWSQTAEQ